MRLGIDLGGTKTEIVALDAGGRERIRRRVPSLAGDYRATVETIAHLVRAADSELGVAGTVGIGIPGTISPATGLVKNANSTWLIGHPLDRDLAAAIGRPVRIANDANCFALSEAADGAGAGYRVVFGVILGTGVGGGLAIDGAVVAGANAIAGEWGHNPLPWAEHDEAAAPRCWCGKNHCIETFLSGPALERDWKRATGKPSGAAEIVRRAEAGDTSADAVLRRYEIRLAKALASVINLLDPDTIVLGGGVANAARLYRNVPPLWQRFAFSDEIATSLLPARHGDSSGVRGAARLWPADASSPS